MYAGVACACCMGHMVVVLEHTPIPTLSPYFFHQFIPTFYLIFSKIFNVLVCLLFWWPLAILNYLICHHQHQHSFLQSSQFCVFSIPLQAHYQEPKRNPASLNCGSYMYSTDSLVHWTVADSVLSAQDRLSIPQETELKAAYISLAALTPNDERPHPDNWRSSVQWRLLSAGPVLHLC